MITFEKIKLKMIELGAIEDNDGDIVFNTDTQSIVYYDKDDTLAVSSAKGFTSEYMGSLLEYPLNIGCQIIWNQYLIPNNIITQEEYDELCKAKS